MVNPAEAAFSGFVFKIQANMDPRHRDRIAFFRVCSGRYRPGMKVQHPRVGREMKIANALTFMANERVASEDAVAGDIIGIHNHGQLQIGDTLGEFATAGEALNFKGIPYFAPELFRKARLRNPLKSKSLREGLRQLGEEGAVQVFSPLFGNDMILGAVGALQFEVVAHRLQSEYGVDAIFEDGGIFAARWVTCDDAKILAEFKTEFLHRLALDAGGNLAYLPESQFRLDYTQEKWPLLQFHTTREHAVKLG